MYVDADHYNHLVKSVEELVKAVKDLQARVFTDPFEPVNTQELIEQGILMTNKPTEPNPRDDYSWVPEGHERFKVNINGSPIFNTGCGWCSLDSSQIGSFARADAANCAIEYWHTQIKHSLNNNVVIRHIIAARHWRDAR